MTAKRILKRVALFLVLVIAGLIFYFSLGSEVSDNLDIYIYELPFKEGTGHKVVQGYGGRFSHKNIAALDFSMPVGTPVHAAREGVVIKKGMVAKGQLIGYSGNTGFVLRPHLHFAVKLRLNFKKDSFIRTKFRTTYGVLLLERGEIYKKPVK